MLVSPRVWAALGCASFALGAVTAWAWPSETSVSTSESAEVVVPRPRMGTDLGAAAASVQDLDGVIAIGDGTVRQARACLRERGITVHPESVATIDELLPLLETAVVDRAAVFVHIGAQSGIVDGDIVRAIGLIGTTRRVVWATIQIPDPWDGSFSFEERTNASIRNVVGRYPEGRVLDWHAATAKHGEWTVDGATMSPAGCREYAARVLRLSGLDRRT